MTPRPAPQISITRKATFCASHRYHNPAWSRERNREVFGPCNNPHGHGHNYVLEVTVEGRVDPDTGMVLNLTELDAVIQKEVIARFDHRHINLEVSGFEDVIPTTENVVIRIWELLEPPLRRARARLSRLRLAESPDLWAEVRGESGGGGSE